MLFFRKASSIANKFKFRQAETGLIRAIYSFVIGITPFVIGIMTFMIAICTFVIAITMFMIGIEFLLQNTQKRYAPMNWEQFISGHTFFMNSTLPVRDLLFHFISKLKSAALIDPARNASGRIHYGLSSELWSGSRGIPSLRLLPESVNSQDIR